MIAWRCCTSSLPADVRFSWIRPALLAHTSYWCAFVSFGPSNLSRQTRYGSGASQHGSQAVPIGEVDRICRTHQPNPLVERDIVVFWRAQPLTLGEHGSQLVTADFGRRFALVTLSTLKDVRFRVGLDRKHGARGRVVNTVPAKDSEPRSNPGRVRMTMSPTWSPR